jgi:hypothetical protein
VRFSALKGGFLCLEDEIRSGGAKVFHDHWIWRRSVGVNPSKSFRLREFDEFCVFVVKEENYPKS